MKRSQWNAILLAVLLFASGAFVGALGYRYYTTGIVNAKTAENFRHHYVSEMKSKLHLSSAQVSQLETILDETKAKYKAVRDASRPAMLQIKKEHMARVKAILTPQQIPIYEQLVAERERRAKEQEESERGGEDRHHSPRGREPGS